MFKKLTLLGLIVLSSCVMKINEESMDLNSDYEGLITAKVSSVEKGQVVEFQLRNLSYNVSTKKGVPSIDSYGWDFECDGVEDKTTSLPYAVTFYSEEGAYNPCVNINYRLALGMEKYPKVSKINTNNFEREKIYVTKEIADFNISSEATDLVAGVLAEENSINIKAIDAEGNGVAYAGVTVSAVEGSSVYYKSGSVYVEGTSFVADENGDLEVFIKAKENIIEAGSFNQDNTVELKSNKKDAMAKEYNMRVIPGPVSSIIAVSTGGIFQNQDADTEEADFGQVILKLVDEFNNPVYSSNINVKIENTDGTELSKAWLLSSNGYSDGLEISGTTLDNTNVDLAGKFYFKVKLNDDKSKGSAKVTATTENDKTYEFNISVISGAATKIKACCGESSSEDPEDCNIVLEAGNPGAEISGTGFKVKLFDKNDNVVEAGAPVYVKLMSGTGSPLNDFTCSDCREETDLSSYGPSLDKKDSASEYNVEFYSDRDNTDTYEKTSPYVTNADGLVSISELVAGKLKSENNGHYGLRVSIGTAPVLTETDTFVDFSNLKVNPRAASGLRFNTASLEATDVDLLSEGIQWYKNKSNLEDLHIEVVDIYGNLVESGTHNVSLSAVDYASNETLQNNPSVGNLYIEEDLITKDLAVGVASLGGVASFSGTSFRGGASSYFPMFVKLFTEAEFGGVSKKELVEVEILESVEYEVTNIAYSYSGGVWAEGSFVAHDSVPIASFGDIYSDVTATITIRNKGVITSPNELRITDDGGANYSIDASDCEGKFLESEETCDVIVTYTYGGGGSLGASDLFKIYLRDDGEDINTKLITINTSGHRKVLGALTLVSIDADTEEDAVAYGSVNYASDVESTLVLKNSGEVKISGCTYPETPSKNSYLVSLEPNYPMVYNTNETLKYKFTTVDAELGLQSQSLGITCNLENGGTTNLSIAVSGTRLTNAIIAEAADKTSFDFGSVTSGTPCEEFLVRNEGETAAGLLVPLNFSLVGATNFEIQDSGATDCSKSEYQIISGSSAETCKIKVCFTQNAGGTYSDTLRVVADLGNTVDISLSAQRLVSKLSNFSFENDLDNNVWRPDGHWFMAKGISRENVLGAYQAINVASKADSYINLANPGTYNLFSGNLAYLPAITLVEPSWNSSTGWDFSNSTVAGLRTGIYPQTVQPYGPANYLPWTALASYSNLSTKDRQFLIGAGGRNGYPNFFIWPIYADTSMIRCGNHAHLYCVYWLNFGGFKTEGVMALAGQSLYFYDLPTGINGPVAATANSNGTISTREFIIGYDVTGTSFYGNMQVKVASIFKKVLTKDEIEAVSFQSEHIGNLTASINTDAGYIKMGNQSLKLVASGGDGYFTQAVDTSSLLNHTLEVYVYNGTTGNIGGSISASDIELVFNGEEVSTTYTNEGAGWWKISYFGNPIAGTQSYGVKVKSGKSIYLDAFVLVETTSKFANHSFEDDLDNLLWRSDGHWFMAKGISKEEVVGAYQAKNVASIEDSYINLVNPGTYDLFSDTITYISPNIPLIEPNWNSTVGWDFSNSVYAGLRTGIFPESVEPYGPADFLPWTILASYSNLGTSGYQFLIGANGRLAAPQFFVWPIYSSTSNLRSGNHNLVTSSWSSFGGYKTQGIFALAGQSLYFYDLVSGIKNPISGGGIYSGTLSTREIVIGFDVTCGDWASGFMQVQVASIYKSVLTKDQIEAVSFQSQHIGNLVESLNTNASYIRDRNRSLKIVASSGDGFFTQAVNTNNTLAHKLEVYVYNGTLGSEGSSISSTEVALVFNGEEVSTTYTDQGSGWWKISYIGNPLSATQSYGLKVKSGKTIYLDEFILLEN